MHLTKTFPCSAQRFFFSAVKLKISFEKINDIIKFLLDEVVLMHTHNLCFGSKIRNNVHHCKPQVYFTKFGIRGCI